MASAYTLVCNALFLYGFTRPLVPPLVRAAAFTFKCPCWDQLAHPFVALSTIKFARHFVILVTLVGGLHGEAYKGCTQPFPYKQGFIFSP